MPSTQSAYAGGLRAVTHSLFRRVLPFAVFATVCACSALLTGTTARAESYTGPTGILYENATAPNTKLDVHMSSGTSVSIYGFKDAVIFGAISYTGNSYVWDNFQGVDEDIPDGFYCFENTNILNDCTYGSFYIDQGVITQNPLPDYTPGIQSGTYNTRFTSLGITASTSVPKDVHVRVSYYIDPAEVDRSKSNRNPTQISVSIAEKPSTSFTTYSYSIGTTTGTSSIDMTLLDANINDTGDFDILIQFSNNGVPFGSPRPFPEAYIYSAFTLSSKALTSFANPEYNNALLSTVESSKPCGLTDIGGCFVNAFTYMFVPSNESLTTFTDQFDSLWTRSPFIYPAQISSYISSLFPSSGGSFAIGLTTSIGSVTYLSSSILGGFPYASLLRTLMQYGLWFAFAMTVYRKVSAIHEKTV